MNPQFNATYSEWKLRKAEREAGKTRLWRRFMLEFNYNSNHIEGNTLTYGQTELLLLFGKVVGEAKMRDLEEMKAHSVALRMMIEEARSGRGYLTETLIRQVHKTLLRDDYEVQRQLPGGSVTTYTVHAGSYKTRPNSVITVTGERFDYASPEETPSLMSDLLVWYHAEEERGELSPIELAAMFHYRYIRIHPFEDGNGRIARLLVNFILALHDYPLIVVPSEKKDEYLTALNRCDVSAGGIPADGAHATRQQVLPLTEYLCGLAISEMRCDLDCLRHEQDSQWWYNGRVVTFSNTNLESILKAVEANPRITIRDLAVHLGINKSAVQRHMKVLSEAGYLTRLGPQQRGGEWHIAMTRI